MNVLVLATKYFGTGGVQAYTRMFADAAAEGGRQVDVLSLLGGDLSDRSCPGRYLGDQGSRSTPWTQARFVGQAVRHGAAYDLVVCGHVALAPVGHLLLRLHGIPYLVIGHGIEVWEPLGPRRRTALRRARRVVTVSHFTAQVVAETHGVSPARLAVIHPAVDPALLRAAKDAAGPAPDTDTVTLLTVARLSAEERYKGCDAVISALPVVRAAAGVARYVIAGDGDDRPRLQALAEERGVGDAVTFAGRVPREGLPALYRGCDMFVMPSIAERRPAGWTGEGFGIVYIEAAAFGRPVVAGNGGGAPEAVRDGVTGAVVDGRDADAVAAVLIRLALDAPLRRRMGEAGRQWVQERFTFERFRRDVAPVVESALSAPDR